MKTTINIPTHTPALKIPPTMAQLFRNSTVRINNRVNTFFIFNKYVEISCQVKCFINRGLTWQRQNGLPAPGRANDIHHYAWLNQHNRPDQRSILHSTIA